MYDIVKITLIAVFFTTMSAFAQSAYKNSIEMEFVLIPAGSFIMGADRNFEDALDNELPKHKVTISKPFYMGIYEVTQEQWVSIMGSNPSHFKGRNNPVETVSWNDAKKFIKKLNEKENTNKYRLPTEAEWEYAARAGSVKTYGFGDDIGEFKNYGWVKQNSKARTNIVGQKQPNPWGLYDMYGNVFEWVNDLYADNYNISQNAIDPKGAAYGNNRVFRGGSWFTLAKNARIALRSFFPSDDKRSDLGFRVVMSAE
ncbi:MAG: formylglycine-generating enzyme family protein [Campylobacteraceae bacterium]|jgi:formylglycine-generating enzyme required for sulfatase activity|nr:formylglycine-generating enzyme family protein [Campylobacteraceae bacterium]